MGVIYNPILDHMYHARKDHGAFLNDEKLSTSEQKGRRIVDIKQCHIQRRDINLRD